MPGIALLFFVSASALSGASGVTLTGTVVDPSGSRVVDARVLLRMPDGTERAGDRMEDPGAFLFADLPPGSYEVVVAREGFKTSTSRVRIGNRGLNPLRIRLALADLSQEITVDDLATKLNTSVSDNLDVVALKRTDLDNLPTLGQDLVGTAARFLDAASLGSGGATIVVGGMPTSEKGVSASAIQEVRINQNPYSTEFGRPGRGRIEIITSPGGPDYHGTFNFLFRDFRLDARNAFAVIRPEEQREIFEGSFTGPVGNSKRTSFLISGNYERFDLQSVIYARTLSGDVRENFPRLERNRFVSGRLNHQLTEKHQLSTRYEFTDEVTNGVGPGGFALPETAADSSNREHHVYVQLRSVLTPRLINELQTRSGHHYNPTISRLGGVPRILTLDAFTGGGGQADRLSTETHIQFHEVLTWSSGKHLVKAGVSSPDISRRGENDHTNFVGAFYFSSLDDYSAGRPYSFIQQRGDGRLAIWQRELGIFLQDDFRLRTNLSVGSGLRWDWQNYLGDHNNFAPRLSFAYSPGSDRKTVLRGGAGFFYDRTGWRAIADTIRYDGHRLQEVVITNPGFPNPYPPGGSPTSQPPNIVRFAPSIRSPYTLQFSFGTETQVAKQITVAVNYIGARGVKLYRSRDVNAPFPSFVSRPDPGIGVLRQYESSGGQWSQSLELTVRGRLTKYFTGTAQYVLGRTMNDTGGINAFPAYNWDLTGEWSRADFDQRHRVNLAGTLKASKWINLGILFSANSGRPTNVTLGKDLNRDGYANDRPSGTPRNSAEGPGGATLDARWGHDFVLDRKRGDKGPVLTTALEAFNVLNRVNYISFVGTLSSPFFGQPVSSAPARKVQISLRLRL